MTESELIEAVKVYRFEPGDRLIVNVPGRCSMDTADRIKAMMEQWAPGVKVAVFSEGMSLDILRGVPLEPEEELTPERRAELKKDWDKQSSGLSNAREPERV